MRVIESGLGGVLVFEPTVHGDQRGLFFESYREDTFRQAVGSGRRFVQDNHSRSLRQVLRGLHDQVRRLQGKLLRVVAGNDPAVGIAWPLTAPPALSAKDTAGERLADCDVFD